MNPIKEITVYAGGDIDNINTWSGVPYFFCNKLRAQGIKVNYVNTGIERKIEWIYQKLTGTIIIKLLRNYRADYSTSLLRYLIVKHKIKRSILRYPNSDSLGFSSFCYSAAGMTRIPSIMISDWTLDYYMRFILKRKPRFFERRVLRRDDKEIEATDIVFSIFPGITEYLRQKYKNTNIYYLGNAVNHIIPPPANCQELILKKQKSFKLLLIGGKKYSTGLQTLIRAFQLSRADFPNLSVHVIGMTEKDIGQQMTDGVFFYGYLDKNKETDSEIYYNLLCEAAIFINTTSLWPSFQAPIEAMYFYTPLILSPNTEFNKIFGDDIEKCCVFCAENNPELLAQYIKDILCSMNYEKMCKYSYSLVENFSWDVVIDNFLQIVSRVIK
jgi:glycosyltransferase involved in cell wall biosynthesis